VATVALPLQGYKALPQRLSLMLLAVVAVATLATALAPQVVAGFPTWAVEATARKQWLTVLMVGLVRALSSSDTRWPHNG
jgi:hypothetical protein